MTSNVIRYYVLLLSLKTPNIDLLKVVLVCSSINTYNADLETPFHSACRKTDITKLLLEHDASSTLFNNRNYEITQFSEVKESLKVLDLLYDKINELHERPHTLRIL